MEELCELDQHLEIFFDYHYIIKMSRIFILTLAPGWRRVGPHPDGALVEAVRVCHIILMVGHGNTQGDAIAGDCHWGHDQLDIF